MIPEQASNTSVAIIVAIVAFAGTIVGAFIVAASNYFIAVRRERTERRKDAIQLRRAARLIQAEFDLSAVVLNKALKEKEWWPDIMKIPLRHGKSLTRPLLQRYQMKFGAKSSKRANLGGLLIP